jgi:hypothetical protein
LHAEGLHKLSASMTFTIFALHFQLNNRQKSFIELIFAKIKMCEHTTQKISIKGIYGFFALPIILFSFHSSFQPTSFMLFYHSFFYPFLIVTVFVLFSYCLIFCLSSNYWFLNVTVLHIFLLSIPFCLHNCPLKVHKIEIFLASILKFVLFLCYLCQNVKILQKKFLDQAIIGGGAIFPLGQKYLIFLFIYEPFK